MIRPVTLLTSCLLLVACAASLPQLQHLQLSAGETRSPTGEHPIIVLDSVELPDFLLRDELLVRDSAYTLHYNHNRRWAEPLDLGVQRVLGRRLSDLLATRRVILYPNPAPGGVADWRLRVTVQHFEVQGDAVLLRGSGRWEHFLNSADGVEIVEFERRRPLTGDSAAAIAETMSQVLWEFAEELAAPLKPR
jgi:uncharacterized lipoprotein YmbA